MTLMFMCYGLLSRSSAYGVVWLETVYVICVMWEVVKHDDVSPEFCLFLVPFAFFHASFFRLHDAFHKALLDP